MEDNKFLGTESIGKLLFKLALPAICAQLINMLYNIIDRIYIGHIPEVGSLALTGVGVTMPIIIIISAFAALISMGAAPKASMYMGKGDNKTASKILNNCFVLLIGISVVVTLVIQIFAPNIVMIFGASENTMQYALQYLTIYAFGTIFVQLTLGLNAFITAQGFAKVSMQTILIGAIANIVLDPILIFGLNMGVQGAALATIISQAISAIWVITFLRNKKSILNLDRKLMPLDFKLMLPCIGLGLSPFIMQVTESIVFLAFNSSLLKYGGDIAVGSMTILISVMQFSMLPLQGLAQGAQPISSYNFGAGNATRVKGVFKALLFSSMTYSFTLWALIMLFPGFFAAIFTPNPELIEFTMRSLRIYMAVSCIFSIQIACQMTLIAIGQIGASVFLAVLRKIILLVPLIYILPMFIENKTDAVYLAEPIADFIAVSVTIVIFVTQFRKALAGITKLPNNLQEI